ncbi:MAG: hypothetical protein ACLTDR_14775 [Adlercreutzia equolifaciens]
MLVYCGTLLTGGPAVSDHRSSSPWRSLETFLFNINYFTSCGLRHHQPERQAQLAGDDRRASTSSPAVNHTLEFSNLNTEVHNIWLNFDYRQPAQDLAVKIQFTDDAHHTYFDPTEYTVGVPRCGGVHVSAIRASTSTANTTGLVENLRIEIAGEDVELSHQA